MKSRFITIASILLLSGGLVGGIKTPSIAQQQKAIYVYICQGSKSTKYHRTDRCKGLNGCSTSLKKVTLKEAQTKHKRKPCKVCYGK